MVFNHAVTLIHMSTEQNFRPTSSPAEEVDPGDSQSRAQRKTADQKATRSPRFAAKNLEDQNIAKPSVREGDHSDQLLTIRRAPSLLAFGITGAVLGFILAILLTLAFNPVEMYALDYSRPAVFGVLGVMLGALGATVAIILALILDRRSAKNPQTVRAVEADRN